MKFPLSAMGQSPIRAEAMHPMASTNLWDIAASYFIPGGITLARFEFGAPPGSSSWPILLSLGANFGTLRLKRDVVVDGEQHHVSVKVYSGIIHVIKASYDHSA